MPDMKFLVKVDLLLKVVVKLKIQGEKELGLFNGFIQNKSLV